MFSSIVNQKQKVICQGQEKKFFLLHGVIDDSKSEKSSYRENGKVLLIWSTIFKLWCVNLGAVQNEADDFRLQMAVSLHQMSPVTSDAVIQWR